MTIPAVVGTRVRAVITGLEGTLNVGDLGTVVGLEENTYGTPMFLVKMDVQRDQRLRSAVVDGVEVEYNWRESLASGSWEVVVPTGPVVGGRVRILTDGANGATVDAGDLGTITETEDYDGGTFYVKMDNPRAGGVYTHRTGAPEWVFNSRHVEFVGVAAPEPEVTLESFRIKFLEGAVARGIANGERHSAQVTEALDNFARLEFLEPSTTLEAFQARVVALAMESKGRYSWCGEPEAYLTSIGLGHLLPRRMVVEVITEVVVMATPGMSDRDIRTAARAQAATLDDGGSFWTNDPRLVP